MSWLRPSALVNLLRRETSGGAFVPQIDGLRFFAVAWVVIYHANAYTRSLASPELAAQASSNWFNHFASQGFIGVQLFFAISGFILAYPFAQQRLLGAPPVRLSRYYLRRVTRLEPPYFANLLIITALLIAIGKYTASTLLPHLAASGVYLHNVIYGTGSEINGVLWSLEVEVQFYIAAPILALVFSIRQPGVRRAIIASAIVLLGMFQLGMLGVSAPSQSSGYHLVINRAADEHGLHLLHELHYFLVGFLLADLRCLAWKEPSRRPWLWDLAALASWGVIIGCMLQRVALDLLIPPALFVLYAASFRGGAWKAITCSPALYLIGGMCYTIYMWHFFVISAIGRITSKFVIASSYTAHAIMQCALLASCVVVVCSVLFVVAEKPFMRRDWPQLAWAAVRERFGRLSAAPDA